MAASTDLLIRLRADGKQAIGELGRVDGAMGKLQRGVGRAATAGAVALAGLAAASIKEFASFQRGMNEVFTLLPEISATAMDKMSEQVKGLAVDMGVLPEEVVPALYQAISAGVPEKNVFGFLETATKLSIAGVTDLETAVDGLTTITNAYGVENISAQEAADSLFTAMKLGKTTVGEMSASLFQIVPAAAAAGITIDEVAAGLAAITAQGTPTRVAATQMRQAIVELGKAGTIAFKVFEEATGQTFPQFVRGGGTLEEAFQVLAAEAEASGGSISDMFGSVEAGMSALTLTSETGAAAWSSNMEQMAAKTGAVSEGFDTMNEGIARGWDKIQAIISVALIEIGESLAPVVEDFLEAFGDKIPGAAATVAEAFETMVGVVENAARGFGVVKGFFDELPSAAQTAALAIGGVSAALILLNAHPVIFAITAVISLFGLMQSTADDNTAAIKAMRQELEAIGEISIDTIIDAVGGIEGVKTLEDYGLSLADVSTALNLTADEFNANRPLVQKYNEAIHQMRLDNEGAADGLAVLSDAARVARQEIRAAAEANVELGLAASAAEGQIIRNMLVYGSSGVAATTMADAVGEAGDIVEGFGDTAEKVTRQVIGAFDELPKKVKKSLAQMEALLKENIAAKVEWENNLATLKDLGFDAVAAEMEALGPAWATVTASMVSDTSGATARMEEILDQADLLAEGKFAFDESSFANQYDAFQAFLAGNPLWVEVVSRPDRGPSRGPIPSGPGRLGGRQEFHEGGIVPGPRGSEQLIIAQAGEEVIPIDGTGRGGTSVTIVQYIAGSILAEDEVLEIARQGLRDAAIDGGDLELG